MRTRYPLRHSLLRSFAWLTCLSIAACGTVGVGLNIPVGIGNIGVGVNSDGSVGVNAGISKGGVGVSVGTQK